MAPDLPPACEPVAPIAHAVAKIESTRPALNNPLGVSPSGRPLTYPTREHGWRAGCRALLLRIKAGARTIRQLACGTPRYPWPMEHTDCVRYAYRLSRLLGILESTRLSRILPVPHF